MTIFCGRRLGFYLINRPIASPTKWKWNFIPLMCFYLNLQVLTTFSPSVENVKKLLSISSLPARKPWHFDLMLVCFFYLPMSTSHTPLAWGTFSVILTHSIKCLLVSWISWFYWLYFIFYFFTQAEKQTYTISQLC